VITFRVTANVKGLQEQRARVRQRLARAVVDTAEAVLSRVGVSMQEPKSGKVYGTHQASAPGEAPAIETRELLESGKVEPVSERQADIVFTSDHALPMEYGAPAAGIAPRPFLGPALLAEVEDFEHRIADALAPVGASRRVRTVNPR
jgi:hypothetical protein